MKNKILLYITGIAILGIVVSCTKLDETLYSSVRSSDYKSLPAEIGIKFVAPAYLQLHQLAGHNDGTYRGDPWELQSHCTDQTLVPTRGSDWFDGGHFQRLFEHTWDPTTTDFNTVWLFGYNVVNQCNYNIYQINKNFPGLPSALPNIAELKVLRSYGFYHMIDFFGNVPIITQYDSTHALVGNNPDFQTGRSNLYDTIVSNIKEALPYLSTDIDPTHSSFNKWAALALLARVYINGEVWAKKAMYQECINACDSIINSNNFALESDYFHNFKQANQDSKENILVVPYDPKSTEQQECFYLLGWHYSEQTHFKTVSAPWNGFCAIPDHYKSFDSTDVRVKGWVAGPRYAADGVTPLKCVRESYKYTLEYTVDFNDLHVDGKTYNYTNCLEYNGARFGKLEIQMGLQNWCMGVPLPIFRYADILLLKAEALMRLNGGKATAEAVGLVNQVRARAGVKVYTTSTLTMDEVLAERGRELYHECVRRQDLVRFGKFVRGTWMKSWFDRSGETDDRNVFPIPSLQIGSNNMLHQNPGY